MKQITWFDHHFGGWLWLIRYKIANFIIGYNIEDALENHMAQGWEEGYAAGDADAFTIDRLDTPNPYRQGETE